jgi:hypothetical protein
MEHRVTTSPSLSSAHSLHLVRLAMASVWVTVILLANEQEMNDLFQPRQPANPEAKQS